MSSEISTPNKDIDDDYINELKENIKRLSEENKRLSEENKGLRNDKIKYEQLRTKILQFLNDEDENCEIDIEIEEYYCNKIRYGVDRRTNIVYNDAGKEVGTINVLPEDP